MDRSTVFTKTAKGITQVNQKSASLSKDLMKVLKLIDGKSNFGQIMEKAELDKMQLEKALNTLAKDGFARVFQTRQEESDPFAEDDFDFTAPGKIAAPASTQRVVPGAANDISELVRQQASADKDKKAREQAHEAARAKAKVEAESRAKLEAEAKARQQAEQQAMEQARRAKEASERARVELEAKMREEEARRASLAQQQAKFTAEQKAKEEEESRRLAELRVKAEREAKALAEARARAEAEAAAMAKARAEAEAAAQRQAAQATNAEAQMKARLKEEIEARIRGEMEHLLRNELEEKTRDEMKAQILAEARMAAKAELEERLQEERDGIARAEAEARSKAEKDASARADQEAKKRAEAEARAAAETEARMKAEDEARRLRAQAEEQTRRAKEMEARARADAEARAIEQAENAKRIEAERQAKYEAEARAKIEAEERDKRERELSATIEAERRAKEEAEKRAKIEARARETIAEDTRAKVQAELESDMEKRAEIEGKAQAKAYMAAKEKAELDEEERIRADQARKAREIAEVLRTRVEPDEVAPETSKGTKRRPRRSGSLLRTALVVLVLLLLAGLAALHVVPLRPYTAKVERAMSAWLNDQVSISTMTFQLVPTPHLKVQNVAVGKLLDATASEGRVYLDITSLLGDKLAINAIELDNVTLSNEAVRRIPLWGRAEGKPAAGAIDRITLRNVKMEVKPALEPFAATLNFGHDGVLRQANLAAGTWSVSLKPSADGFDFDATANNLTLPAGAPIVVSGGRFKGTWQGNEIVVPEFEAEVLEGKVNGALRVSWGAGVRLQSEFTMAKVNVQQLMAAFTKAIVVTGRAEGSFNVVAEGPTIEQIFAAPRIQGKFRVGDGTISNVDLVAVMQSDTAGQRAGVTKFVELAGELHAADTRLSYQKVNLQGGVLRGNGTVDLGGNGNLAGRISLEIRSQVAQDRGSFVVSGNVQRPSIRRGG
jgi:AsmA-like protein